MARTEPTLPRGFRNLSPSERIDYVQHLWDEITADAETVPVPAWHKRVLDQRIARRHAHSRGAKSWPIVRREIERTLRSRHRP